MLLLMPIILYFSKSIYSFIFLIYTYVPFSDTSLSLISTNDLDFFFNNGF